MGLWQTLFGRRSGEGEGQDSTQRLQRQLESSAHSVSLRRLRSYGLQSVRVIDATTIQGIVGSALDEALRLRGVGVTAAEREEIQSLAKAQLQQLMDENKRLSEVKDEVQRRAEEQARNREDLELSVAVLRRELEEHQKQLELERERLAKRASDVGPIPVPGVGGVVAQAKRPPSGRLPEWGAGIPLARGGATAEAPAGRAASERVAPDRARALRPPPEEAGERAEGAPEPQRVVVVAEFAEEQFSRLGDRLRLIFERLLRDKELFERNGEGDVLPKLATLEAELRDTVQKLISEAKAKVGADDGGERVEMLEKRIGKLNDALSQAESALAKLARMKNVEVGVGSLWTEVGLDESDPAFARKNELLGQVFRDNLELQGKPLEAAPAPLAEPARVAGPSEMPSVPAHFEMPVELPADMGGDAAY